MAKAIKLTEQPWTDDELFDRWWLNDRETWAKPLAPGEDHEEYARRISKLAWLTGAYFARYPVKDSHAFTRRWAAPSQ